LCGNQSFLSFLLSFFLVKVGKTKETIGKLTQKQAVAAFSQSLLQTKYLHLSQFHISVLGFEKNFTDSSLHGPSGREE
jgi:hypothetical protein